MLVGYWLSGTTGSDTEARPRQHKPTARADAPQEHVDGASDPAETFSESFSKGVLNWLVLVVTKYLQLGGKKRRFLTLRLGMNRPIPTLASSLNCLCSKELEEWESKTDTEADTKLSARLKLG